MVHLALPLALIYLLWRSRREPAYRTGIGHRFGLWPRVAPGSVWIFAASAGETKAVGPVIDRLLAEGHSVTLSHSTPAGLETTRRLFGQDARVVSHYAPLDAFWAVRLFLSRVRPTLLTVVEIEIWPAMLIETARAGIPIAHVNGNLVERSVARDRARTGGARMALYPLFDVICTKTDDFADRFRSIGVAADRVRVVGELKFDQPVDAGLTDAAVRMRAAWKDGRRVLTIASSVQGEEVAFADLIGALREVSPPPRIVWVPRSPARFDVVADLCAARGWHTVRRTKSLSRDLAGDPGDDCDVLIGDTLGEMDFYLGLADLVVVGGSLVDHGGHNIMEPLAQGKPVLMGPSVFGIRFAADAAAQAGAFQSLPDVAALTARCTALLSGSADGHGASHATTYDAGMAGSAQDADLAAMASAARAFGARHTGAADLTLDALRPFLTETAP